VLLLSSENAWPRSSTFWAIIDYVSISNDLASSLIYHHWCLGLNVSVIWHEIQSFVGSSWILTSSSLLNVISTIAWVWESLAFGHNDWNLIDFNSICKCLIFNMVAYLSHIDQELPICLSLIWLSSVPQFVCHIESINWIEWNSFQFLSASVQAWGRWHISVISSEGARRTSGGSVRPAW